MQRKPRIIDYLAEELKREEAEQERKARIQGLLKNLVPQQSPVIDFLAEFGD